MWWICGCIECSDFRNGHPDHPWFDDFERTRPPWFYIDYWQKGSDPQFGGFFFVETVSEKQQWIDELRDSCKLVVTETFVCPGKK
jgi:hypothetical protein